MEAETIDLASGVLILTREDGKLAKVTFSPIMRAKTYRVDLDFRPELPAKCQGCGDDLDLTSNGMAWEDQAGLDVCSRTSNGLHIPENLDIPF